MKKTIIFASVAIATLFAFSSCQKESLRDNGSTNGVRIITAEFENNATKTTLNSDGVTPEWKEGDIIRILGTAPNEYADITLTTDNIKNDGRTITFGTSFTGALYAVYPASATTMTSCPDGEITFTIPAIQDGTFGSANICVAKSTEDDGTNKDNLIFRNATAVLKITTSSAVVGVDVTATNFIAGEVTATFSGTAISLTTTSLDRHYVSAVGTSAPTGNVFYLATAPVTTGAAKVNCYTTEKKGTVEKESKDLSKNIIYNMDLTSVVPAISDLTGQHGLLNGHEYVIIKAKYDGSNDSYRKWATMNIGASSEADYGYYFFWGGIVGYKRDGSKWVKESDNEELSGGFIQNNDPHYDNTNSTYTKYTGTSGDNKPVLELADDAANANWGGSWRMPTKAEFDALCELPTTSWQTDYNGSGVNGYLFTDAYDNSIFLPAAGCGDSTDLDDAGGEGCYWSSSLNTSDPSLAYCLDFFDDSADSSNSFGRYYGLSVRALSE